MPWRGDRRSSDSGGRAGSGCGWCVRKWFARDGDSGITATVDAAAARLWGSTSNLVQIEQTDALRLIERYDNRDVLRYLNPSYVRSARKSGRLYCHEMDDADQRRLLELVRKSKAKIAISGYASALYDEALADWHRFTTFSQTTSTKMVEVVIWLNYEPPFRQMAMAEASC